MGDSDGEEMAQGFQALESRCIGTHGTLRGCIPVEVKVRPTIESIKHYSILLANLFSLIFNLFPPAPNPPFLSLSVKKKTR